MAPPEVATASAVHPSQSFHQHPYENFVETEYKEGISKFSKPLPAVKDTTVR